MKANNVWPVDGVEIHTANWDQRPKMQALVDEHYGGKGESRRRSAGA
jgi:hypothetical protein